MKRISDVFALDFDGVIANTTAMKAAWIRANLGRRLKPWQCDRSTCVPIIGESAYRAMFDALWNREATELASPVDGALDALEVLAAHGDVHVITARQPGRLDYAERWLAEHGVARLVSSVSSSAGTDKRTCSTRLGARVLVDDDARHLADAVVDGLEAILFKPGCRTLVPRVPAGATLCRSWSEVLAFLGLPASWTAMFPGHDLPALQPAE